MKIFESALAFLKGISSVIDAPGLVRGTISDAITKGISGAFANGAIQASVSDAVADGIERAFRGIRAPLERTLMKIAFGAIGLFFMVWGVAQLIDYFAPFQGLGFVVVGGLFGAMALFFLAEKETGKYVD